MTTQTIQPDLLRDRDVAKKLQVSPATVRGWVSQGLLKSVHLGRSLRFDPEYIAERLEAAKNGESFLERPRYGH